LSDTGSFADPGAETWTATVNYDDGSGTQPLTLNPDKTFALVHTYATTGVYTLTVTVTDSHGGTGSDTATVTVRNVAPTATLSNNGPVSEGSPVTVSFTNPFDPSPGDAVAGFHYSFALSPSGLAASYAAAGTAASASFTFDDGPANPVVYGRIFDRDNGFTDYTTTVVVNNVAPTATLSNTGPVAEGSPVTVSFANPSDPSAADTAAGFHYSFALSASGLAAGYAAAGTAASASFTFDDNGSYTVYGRILDKDGGFTDSTTTVVVNNVAPTATLSNTGPVGEGSPVTVSFANPSDPSAADTAAGFHYSFALAPSGLAASYAAAGTAASASFTFDDGPSGPVVYGRIFDKDGGFTDYQTTVTVTNVAPTATLSNNGPVGEGSPATVSFTNASDPSAADTAAGFHYSFALSASGLATSYAAAGTASSASFTFDDGPASPVVYGRIFDKDGGFTDYTTTVVVNNVAPTATLSNNGPINEGGTAVVSFSGASDPSEADTAAGFHYSFALDPSNLAAGYAAAGTASSASFTFNDNGSYTVYGRVFDKDGGFTDSTTTVVVNNVAPTATLSNTGPVAEGSPATVSFANASDPSSADTAAGFHYSFALDPSGLAASYAAAGMAASELFTFDDGPSSPVVYGRIFDKDGGFTDSTTTVTVTNVAPTATLSNNGPVGVGSPATVSFTSASDPSAADTAAGFHYSFALDPSGLAAGYAAAGTAASASFTFNANGSYTVYGRIFDKDGGFTDSTTTVTVVSNGTLTAGIAGPAAGVRGQTLTFTLTASDPSPANQAAGFTYVVSWGDGTAAQTVAPTAGNGAGVAVGHVFTRSGTYTVQVTATNKDGVSSTAAQTVAVTALALQTDPFDPTKVDLVVGGTTGDDVIEIKPAGCGAVRVLFGGVSKGVFAPTGRLVVFGQAGDDALLVSSAVTLPAWLYGGAGNNLLKGGSGNNVLVGGPGNDVLIGGRGRDLLIGGGGSDLLISLSGSDILIAGTTAYDANEAGLGAIMAEWTSADSFATRVTDLTNPRGALAGRLNGNYFLLAGGPGQTVFNDGATDILIGGPSPDLFFAGPGDIVLGFNIFDQVFLDS
jgi:peptidoglycan/xylan/chitin deacetylase (PgdA/CDA1 family)